MDSDQTVIAFSSEQDLENDLGTLLVEHAVLVRHSQRLKELFEAKDRLREEMSHALQDFENAEFETSLERARKLLRDVPESGRVREIIAACQERVSTIREREESLAGLVKLVASAEGEERSAPNSREVIDLASQILEKYPEDAKATSAQHRAREQLEEIRNETSHLESRAREEIERSNFKEARELIDRALVLDPEHEPARVILNQLQSHLEVESNRLRALDLLQDARELEAQEQLEASLSKVEEAQDLDPSNTGIIRLRKRLLPQVEKLRTVAAHESQIESLLERAQRAIGGWRLGTAKVALDEVLSLEANRPEALELQELLSSRRQTKQKVMRWGLPLVGLLLVALTALLVFPPSPTPSLPKIYQVQRGDSLLTLATRFETSTEQISLWNSLSFGQTLIEGQMLFLGSSAADYGTLLVEIVPWAWIESLEHVESGAMMIEGVATTPLRLELPVGEYRVTASNSTLGGEDLVFQVRIEAGITVREQRSWLSFDLDRELDAILESQP